MTRDKALKFSNLFENGSRHFILVILLLAVLVIDGYHLRAGIVSPRGGGSLPEGYLLQKRRSRDSYTLRYGWINKRRRALTGREVDSSVGPAYRGVLSSPGKALGGLLNLPVVLGLYSDVSEPPAGPDQFQQMLFDGPFRPGTMREYYGEVSFGLLDMSGVVFDWISLTQSEAYYTGGFQGLTPPYSRTGELIGEILVALDSSVDFGIFDNDGPDGVPNSGDDDGFVDVLIVVQPTAGAECGNFSHMWSHSWNYSNWPASGGQPFSTGDPASGGGVIKVEDYIIGPSISCSGGMIEIGLFCHELGHALGLPDLYDPNGGSVGIGNWGLMGTGNWNAPESPAHLCAWSREQLGWVEPVEIDWRERNLELTPVALGGEVAKLALPTRRFMRRSYAPYPGANALICGYTESEANEREWFGGEGYGNGWEESMIHEFHPDGTGPCIIEYGVGVDIEDDYDFGMLLLEEGGRVETLAVYTGQLPSINESINLSDYLPVVPCDFILRFLFVSDFSVSDEDGGYDSMGGWTFNIDNIRINGGGIDYFCDFESDAGGWRSDSEPAEYFLVENRRRYGFDTALPGEGLLIWHAENSIAYSSSGNSGGYTNSRARGLVLEEADGLYNLLSGENKGDGGDPFPGSNGNTSFGSGTVPDSRSNGGRVTPVTITGINRSGSTVSGFFRAGLPPPVVTAAGPNYIDKSEATEAVIDIFGESFQYGATCFLSKAGVTVEPREVSWLGDTRLVADFPLDELFGGGWRLTVVNGDGQSVESEDAVYIVSPIFWAGVDTGRSFLRVSWWLNVHSGGDIRGFNILRSSGGGGFEIVNDDTLRNDGQTDKFIYKDATVQPGVDYSYRVVAYYGGGGEEVLSLPGPYRIEDFPFTADQNFPNPFREKTTISFFVPSSRTVAIDIYNVAGRLVYSHGAYTYERGTQQFEWRPGTGDLSSGVYFCVFKSGRTEKVVKMLLIR